MSDGCKKAVKNDKNCLVLALVLEWASLHRAELREAWERASHNQEPSKIQPLD